jgi:dephospho-CoA kinase
VVLQVPDAEKRARADFVVDTGVPLADTRAAVEQLVARLRSEAPVDGEASL